MEKTWTFGSMLILLLFVPDISKALTCDNAGESFPHPGTENQYIVDSDSFGDELEWPSGQQSRFSRALGMIAKAKRAWNDTANAGWFQRFGALPNELSGPVDIALSKTECQALSGRGLIKVVKGSHFLCPGSAKAGLYPVCDQYPNIEDGWYMGVCSASSRSFEWSANGSPGTNERDLVQVLAHEMGHILGLGHPPSGCGSTVGATMCGTAPQGTIRQRQLYNYDSQCLHQMEANNNGIATTRSTDSKVFRQKSGGGFTSNTQNPTSFFKASTIRVPGKFGEFRAMLKKPDSSDSETFKVFSDYYAGSSGEGDTTSGLNKGIGIVPTLSYWDTPQWDGVLRLYTHQESGSGPTAPQRVTQRRYDLANFPSPPFSDETLAVCDTSQCNSTLAVQSGYRLSHAYDSSENQMLAAWQNQNRQGTSSSQEIWIAAGAEDLQTLKHLETTGDRSVFNPSIACAPNEVTVEGGDFDCILAYVPYGDAFPKVNLRYFEVDGSGNYSWAGVTKILDDPSKTGGAPAVWFNEGDSKWYAAKVIRDSSTVDIYSSSDGVTWTKAHDGLGFSVTSPVANNMYSSTQAGLVFTQP